MEIVLIATINASAVENKPFQKSGRIFIVPTEQKKVHFGKVIQALGSYIPEYYPWNPLKTYENMYNWIGQIVKESEGSPNIIYVYVVPIAECSKFRVNDKVSFTLWKEDEGTNAVTQGMRDYCMGVLGLNLKFIKVENISLV